MKPKPSILSPVVLSKEIVSRSTIGGIAIDYFNIVLCKHGEAELSVNLQPFKEVQGTVVFFFPGDVIKVERMSDDFELESLMCSADIWHEASEGINQLYLHYLHCHFHIDQPLATAVIEQTFNLMETLLHAYSPTLLREIVILQVKSILSSFVLHAKMNPSELNIKNTRSDNLFNAFKYHLGKHYRKNRDVLFYADKMHVTPKTLSTVVKENTGKSAKAAIDAYTVMQLKLTLSNSEQSIKEVAWQYNFSSLPFFCEYFRRHTGMTPQQWREG